MTSFRFGPFLALAACLAVAPVVPASAEDAPANDTLNAVLWMQRSVEYKATALGAFALAQVRLDQALADKSWSAAPAEQTGAYQDLPPAIIMDADETILDNSGYQAWLITAGESFNPKSWTQFVKSETSTPIPGAVEFAKYADSKGVKVFYISNRTKEEEDATRAVMTKYGFPMGGNVDTFLSAKEQPDWGSAKGTRRAVVAKDYRVLLLVGDNFGDFSDGYKGTEDERLALYEADKARWGHDWIMLPNPAYGSFESAPFKHDFKVPAAEQRAMKRGVLTPWDGK